MSRLCGTGNFLIAAVGQFAKAERAFAMDINGQYVDALKSKIQRLPLRKRMTVDHGDFFDADWQNILQSLPEPVLVIGNPP